MRLVRVVPSDGWWRRGIDHGKTLAKRRRPSVSSQVEFVPPSSQLGVMIPSPASDVAFAAGQPASLAEAK